MSGGIDKSLENQCIDPSQMQLLKESEYQIFKENGYDMSSIEFYDQEFQFRNSKQHLHTFKTKNDHDKPILIVVHGFGGSIVTFVELLKVYQQKYRIYAIDMLGMGLSSRPKFEIDDYHDTVDFFIDSIKQFIDSIVETSRQKVNLLGHSLGGYILSCFVCKYPANIQSLFLLSPPGSTFQDPSIVKTRREQFEKMENLYKFDTKLWTGLLNKYKYTPMIFYQSFGKYFGNYFVKRELINSLNRDPNKQDFPYLVDYFRELYSLPESSEKALYNLLNFDEAIGVTGRVSIQEMFETSFDKIQSIDVQFFYGDQDWMDRKGSYMMRDKLSNVKVHIIQKSNHHLNMLNPSQIFEKSHFYQQ